MGDELSVGLAMRRLVPKQVKKVVRPVLTRVLGRTRDASVWEALLKSDADYWAEAKRSTQGGPRILIATSMGGFQHGSLLESSLSVALTLRGAQVDVLLCDECLPACQLTEIASTPVDRLLASRPQPRCESCVAMGEKMFGPLGLTIYTYGGSVTSEQASAAREIARDLPAAEIGEYRLDKLAVGEHAMAGALRYFARGNLDGEPNAEAVLRGYLEAALLTVYAVRGLLDRNDYDAAVFNHGIYVPQGLIGEVCRARRVRVINWNPAYRKHCFIFSHGDSYHHTMLSEPTGDWEGVAWTPALEKKTMDYLKSRWRGEHDWIWFHDRPEEDLKEIARETGADFSKPTVGMLTNVMWDAQLHFGTNAFGSMLDWVLATVRYFAKRPDLQLVIRVHPAEVRGAVPSRQQVVAELEEAFPSLPANVFVVPPESQISTYALVEKCNAVIIYGTKTGIEVSSAGVPVIVAGEAWIRGKGFSRDAGSTDEYYELLDGLPFANGLSGQELERARKYAYHFFFRRMIPLPFIGPSGTSQFTLDISSLRDLAPGRFPGLDVICDGILAGTPFIYRAEELDVKEG